MFRSTGGEKLEYTIQKWYKYEAHKLKYNIDKFDKYFPGRNYISSDDIIEYIAYCKYGCFLLLQEMKEMKKKIRNIEERIKMGKWLNNNTASICNLNSNNIDLYINNIANISLLEQFTNLVHENIYISYFYNTYPNIFLPDPKTPQFPDRPTESIKINDKDKIIDLIHRTIPYLNVLETFHGSIYKLISFCNEGLEKLLQK